MTEEKSILAVFADLDPAADAIEQLRHMGVHDECMNVISGIPVTEAMLGRPSQWTNVPRLAMGGAILGFLVGIFLAFVTPTAYGIKVGGQGFAPVPPAIIVLFEMTMLGMLLSTFLGVFLDSFFPNYGPMEYVSEISDGKIGIFFRVPQEEQQTFTDVLGNLGAESVKPAEARQL